MSRPLKLLLAFLGLLTLYGVGMATRRVIVETEQAAYGDVMPFTLESALEYRLVRGLYETGRLPRRDPMIQTPEGVITRETYTVGAEYVYALGARLLPDAWPLTDRVRWVALAWFCLGIPALSLWLYGWLRSVWAAGIGGAFYAVSLAAVIRSTGQELSHENFALPWLIAHLAFGAWALRGGTADAGWRASMTDRLRGHYVVATALCRRVRWFAAALNTCLAACSFPPFCLPHFLYAALSAVCLGVAVMTWDLMQYYVFLWAGAGAVALAGDRYWREAHRRLLWWGCLFALVAVGVWNPYLRAHAFLLSYGMWLAYGVSLALLLDRCGWSSAPLSLLQNPRRRQGIAALHIENRRLSSVLEGRNSLRPSVGGVLQEAPLAPLCPRMVEPVLYRLRSVFGSFRLVLSRGGQPCVLGERAADDPSGPGAWRGVWARLRLPLLAVLLALLGALWCRPYAETYGHFLELVWAKLRFLNQKPADPALLTFAQRILWTPALDSATFRLTGVYFPAMLPLLLLTVLAFGFKRKVLGRSDPELIRLFGYSLISLLAFVLFKRFHVFPVVFMAALMGWLAWWAGDQGRTTHGLILILLVGGVALEAVQVWRDPVLWGRRPAYLRHQMEVAEWLKTHDVREPVLANFGVSAALLAYGGCPIVLHPKFETPALRARVQAYGEVLFRSDEAAFRDWADRQGARYYVFARGEFADIQPDCQMRYFIATLQPPRHAVAWMFERQPDTARYFTLLWENAKYRVFRVIGAADERQAARWADEAWTALQNGRLEEAERRAELALMRYPRDARALQVMRHVGSLRAQGVR